MKRKYASTTRVKRQQLQAFCKEFEILHMKQGELVDEYFSKTLQIVNKMSIPGGQMDDAVVIEKIL